ncbi:MAG: mycothiol synthase [Microlunatus sp.]|nr:mycothiol synthase [Microlunatus sp.]MDN5771403.1 mycothiol synthase [Microlunatus sp.]
MADPIPSEIIVTDQPSDLDRQDAVALAQQAEAEDGHAAVNEAGLFALQQPSPGSPGQSRTEAKSIRTGHALARDPNSGDLVGYGQVRWENGTPVAALVVHPGHRRQGLGSRLWRALSALAGEQSSVPLQIWASGDGPAARTLAAKEGLRAVRTLLVLSRSLAGSLPPAEPPDGTAIRAFRPGVDDAAWLAVNARAFADHPEQGSVTSADLAQRMAEPWFDPDGFFLAVKATGEETAEQVLGFHWTKREPGADVGEVYVIGVDPQAGIRGLGTPLLGAGLAYLRDRGATEVELYVESDNERALNLYHRHGFARTSADVMYAVVGPG